MERSKTNSRINFDAIASQGGGPVSGGPVTSKGDLSVRSSRQRMDNLPNLKNNDSSKINMLGSMDTSNTNNRVDAAKLKPISNRKSTPTNGGKIDDQSPPQQSYMAQQYDRQSA